MTLKMTLKFLFSSNTDNNMYQMTVACRGGSRTAATSKMERFVIIVNGLKLSIYFLSILEKIECQ